MANGQVHKIYKLSTLGYNELNKELENVQKKFEAIKKAKLSAQGNLFTAADQASVKKYADELGQLTVKEQQLRVETERLSAEIKAQMLQRQVDINKRREEKGAVDAAAGSYNALYKEYRELYKLIKTAPEGSAINFKGELLQFDQAIAKLKQLAAAEQDFRRQFARDGLLVGEYTSGIVQAFKSMGLDDLIGGQVTKATQKLDLLNQEFNELQQELSETRVTGQGALEGIERQLIENRKEAIALQQQVGFLRNELRGSGDIGSQITTSLANGFKNVRTQVGQLLVGYLGVQAVLQGIVSGVDGAKQLSDATTDLELQLGKAAGGADNLVASLSKLDTRTNLLGLQQIADTALKAGTTAKNIEEVTKAVDTVKTAFGAEFGSVQEGTETFAKLINIFFEDREITGERILQIGNAIRTLANETVASVPFINDFNGRMAGLRQLFTNFELSDSIGLGAGFEEFKQSAEVASTVLVKVLPKLAADTEKFAAIAGMSKEAFADLINSDPTEALIRVSEALVKSGKNVEEVSASLADSELGSGRITTILATLGGKADVFRERIARAGVAINDTQAITDAFNQKNENLAATLDKVGKKFADAANGKAFQLTITAISAVILFLINNLGIIISLLSVLGVTWGIVNAQMIATRTTTFLTTLAIQAQSAAVIIANLVTRGYALSVQFLTSAFGRAAVASTLLSTAIKLLSGPIGIVIGVISLLTLSFAAYGRSISTAVVGLNDFVRAQRVNADINRQAAAAISEQKAEIDGWILVIKSATSSADTKKKAVEELTKIDKAFGDVIKDNVVDLAALDKAYQKVIGSITAKARAEAAATLAAEKQKNVAQVAGLRQDLEIQVGRSDQTVLDVKLSEEQKRLLQQSNLFNTGAITQFTDDGAQIFRSRFDQVKKFLDAKEKEALDIYKDYLQAKIKTEQELKNVEDAVYKSQEDAAAGTTRSFEVDIELLKSQIKALDDQIEKFKGSQKDLNKLIAERKRLQALLDKALGNSSGGSYRGAKLTGEQKDAFKDIDAVRDRELADEKRFRAQNLESEEDYLLNIRDINIGAIDEKLSIIKGANAEERKLIAELKLERISQEQDANNKIFELRSQALRNLLDQQVSDIRTQSTVAAEDPTLSETQRAQIKLTADQKILSLQEKFASDLDLLEKQLGQQSLKNSKDSADAIRKTQEDLRKDQIALTLASLKDVQNAGEKSIAEFRAIVARQRANIAGNENLSPDRRNRANANLDREENVGVVAREVASLRNQLPVYKQLLNEKQITDTAYMEFLAELENKQAELSELLGKTADEAVEKVRSTRELIQGGIRDLFKTEEGSPTDQLIGQAISETYDIAQQAMNDFFDAKEARIKRDLEVELERLEIEKGQQLARAQSLQEQESLEKQFAAKKQEAERQSFEKTKQLRKKEAKIALLTELANIWTTVWQVGPIAGAILGAVLSGLALLRFNSRMSEINAQTFARGGQPGKTKRYMKARRFDEGGVPAGGGEIGGKPHSQGGTPFVFKGQPYEAEADELAVIRTRNAPRNKVFQAMGTQSQIASAMNRVGGGVDFSPGGSVKKLAFGGGLGQSLQAPQYVPSNVSRSLSSGEGMSDERFAEMIDKMEMIADAQSRRIDRLEVVQVTGTVTTAQKKQVKQNEIGTL
jgi:hypothetical protein